MYFSIFMYIFLFTFLCVSHVCIFRACLVSPEEIDQHFVLSHLIFEKDILKKVLFITTGCQLLLAFFIHHQYSVFQHSGLFILFHKEKRENHRVTGTLRMLQLVTFTNNLSKKKYKTCNKKIFFLNMTPSST